MKRCHPPRGRPVPMSPRVPLRTMQILYELAARPAPVSLADLSVRLNLPKTSLFRLLKTLESGDYVLAVEGGYKIGAATLKLGAAIINTREFPNCAIPVMQAVSDQCGETIILGTLADNHHEVVYTEVIDATNLSVYQQSRHEPSAIRVRKRANNACLHARSAT